MESEDSVYSCDEEYFLDICRGGQLQEIQEFIAQLKEGSEFDWLWTTNSRDNFLHMIAANNLYDVYDKIIGDVKSKIAKKQVFSQILNAQNSSANTPLHYGVINGAKEIIERLIAEGVDPNIENQFKRTPLMEAEQFDQMEIAEMLAPITKIDIEMLKKQTAGLELNNDSSDQESQQEESKKPEQLQKIEEQQSRETENMQTEGKST